MRASDSRFARYAHIIIPPPPHTPHTQRRRVTGVACVAVVLICPLHGAGNSGVASWHWLAAHVVSMRTRRVRSLSAILCLPAGGFDLHPPGGAELHATLGGPIEWSRLPRFQRVSLTQAHRGPGRPCRTAPVALHAGTVWRELHGARQADVVVASFGLVALPAVLLRRAVAFCVTQDYDEPPEQVRHARRVSQER